MLQIKNTLGGGKPEGLYAWKKSEVITYGGTISFTQITDGGLDPMTLVCSSNDIDISSLGTDFFIGKKIVRNSDQTFEFKSATTCSYDGADYPYTFNPNNATLEFPSLQWTNSYAWSDLKINTEYGSFNYIVSDKETAYPDGGEKDGYYYERVVEGAKVAYGSVNPTGDLTKLVINHGLGKEPTLIIGYCESNITSIFNHDFIVEGVTAKIKYNGDIYTRTATNVDVNTIEIPKTTVNWGSYNYRWIAIAE